MTREELLALAKRELTTDLPTAGRAWGIGRTLSFDQTSTATTMSARR
jgi:hypothetical protein